MTIKEIEEYIKNDTILGFANTQDFIGFMIGTHFIYDEFLNTVEFIKDIHTKSGLMPRCCMFIIRKLIKRGFSFKQILMYKTHIIEWSFMRKGWEEMADEIYNIIFER